MQVDNWQKTIRIEEKFDVISRLEKGERIVDIYPNVRIAHISVRTVPVITGSAKSGTTEFVWQYYHSAVGMNRAVIIIRN
jgi:hypothetical protein